MLANILQPRFIRARMTLGVAVLQRILRAPLSKRSGPRPWLAHLASENLAPTPESTWRIAEETSRCMGCGLCDAVAAEQGLPPVSNILQGAARRPEDAQLVENLEGLASLATTIERICPVRVNITHMVTLIRDHRAALAETQEMV